MTDEQSYFAYAGGYFGPRGAVVLVYKAGLNIALYRATKWSLRSRNPDQYAPAFREALRASEDNRAPEPIPGWEVSNPEWKDQLTFLGATQKGLQRIPFVALAISADRRFLLSASVFAGGKETESASERLDLDTSDTRLNDAINRVVNSVQNLHQ